MFQPVNLLLAFLFLIQHYCDATDCASSCGNIRINHPFRLKTDPAQCGDSYYELSCEDNAVILYPNLTLPGKSKGPVVGYPVLAINYNNMTIRLANPSIQMDNCGLPTGTSVLTHPYNSDFGFTGYSQYENLPLLQKLSRILCFVSYPNPMAGLVDYVYTSRCNLKRYWYLQVDFFVAYQMENGCRIEALPSTSLLEGGAKNISYIDVVLSFSNVFVLSWDYACCTSKATPNIYNCSRFPSVGCVDPINWKRKTMTNGFDTLFSFFHKIRGESVFSHTFASLNNTLGGHVYDRFGAVTVFGLILNFLLAILITSKLLSYILGSICVTIFLIYKWRMRLHMTVLTNFCKVTRII